MVQWERPGMRAPMTLADVHLLESWAPTSRSPSLVVRSNPHLQSRNLITALCDMDRSMSKLEMTLGPAWSTPKIETEGDNVSCCLGELNISFDNLALHGAALVPERCGSGDSPIDVAAATRCVAAVTDALRQLHAAIQFSVPALDNALSVEVELSVIEAAVSAEEEAMEQQHRSIIVAVEELELTL